MSGFTYNLAAWKTFKQKESTDEFFIFIKTFARHQHSKKEKILKYFQPVARIAKYF